MTTKQDNTDNQSTIHLNQFYYQKDNKVKSVGEGYWSTVSDFFLNTLDVTTNKKSVRLFNFANYKAVEDITDSYFIEKDDEGGQYPRRKQANILFMDALVFDFDGAMSIDEAKERFKDYSYVGYTSHSHLEKEGIEKFRIIIQLCLPIPANVSVDDHRIITERGTWHRINQAVRNFAGPADPKSFETNTIYHLPSVHPDRRNHFECWTNEGKSFDWTELPQSTEVRVSNSYNGKTTSKVKDEDLRLYPDDILSTDDGSIRIGDVDRHISGVVCPFHDDKKGGEFVSKSPRGNIFFHCKHCGTVFMEESVHRPSEIDRTDPIAKEIDSSATPNFDDILDFPTVYHDASDRSLVQKQLEEISKAIRNDNFTNKLGISFRKNTTRILFMPEGSGKSLLAREMAVLGEKIIFACKSWDQAFEKYEGFREYGKDKGFSVDLFLSRDGKARRRFGVKVERTESHRPYRVGRVLDDETLLKFKEKNPNLSEEFIRVCWAFFEGDEFFVDDFLPDPEMAEESDDVLWDRSNQMFIGKDADILVTTHAQLRIINEKKSKIPGNRIVWVDDPDIWDVIDIEAYDRQKHGVIDFENPPKDTTEVNGSLYFKRHPRQSLGFGQQGNTCIYTTTERLTLQAIEKLLTDRKEEYVVHDEMNFLSGGRITILGTSKVRKKTDAIIPIISRLLEKEGFENVLIANGLGTPINHSNSKGNNQLKEMTILVELSQPHPVEKFTCCDALDLNRGLNSNSVGRQLVLDRLHQAIGRNSGYRSAGYECVVLADSHIHGFLLANVRYDIDRRNSVQIDRIQDMSRNDRRTTANVSDFVATIETLINNVDQLVSNTQRIRPAIKHVVSQIEDRNRQESYLARLLLSLTTHSGMNFWGGKNNPHPDTRLETQYRDLGDWILSQFVVSDRLETVLREYRKILLESGYFS